MATRTEEDTSGSTDPQGDGCATHYAKTVSDTEKPGGFSSN